RHRLGRGDPVEHGDALSRADAPGAACARAGRVGRLRQQPPRALLQPDRGRPSHARGRAPGLAAARRHHGRAAAWRGVSVRTLREWLVRASAFVRPARPDADLEEELRSHASFAADAGRADRGAAHAMDALRDQRGLPWLDDLARDARYGARMLWRDRALSLVIVAILAAGIGAATAIYSLVDACLLRSDMPTYDRWVALRAHLADGSTTLTFFSEPELADARRATDVFDAVGAVSDGDFPERVLGTYVTADVMPMLAVAPLLGRTFRSDEDRPGAPAVTVISYS